MPKKEKARAAEPRIPNGGNGGPPCDPDDFAVATIQGPTTIGINQNVQLQGTAQEEIITAQCHLTKKSTQFSWQLFLKPTGGTETDVSASLVGGNTLAPSFVATKFGTYRAVITAGNNQIGFDTAELSMVVFQPTLLLESEGKLTFLRVNEVGDSFGPAGDAIRVEAIAQLVPSRERASALSSGMISSVLHTRECSTCFATHLRTTPPSCSITSFPRATTTGFSSVWR